MRNKIKDASRVVVKLGSNLFFDDAGLVAYDRIFALIDDLAGAKRGGRQVIVVSSGAVALGSAAVAMKPQGALLAQKQAFAAVGQSRLMNLYERGFSKHGLLAAQALVTEEDFSNRARYLNLRNTLLTLLDMDVIPVINENDTVATGELEVSDRTASFSDNDKLSALVASKLEAQALILLSDVDGLYTENPRANAEARLLKNVEEITPEIEALAGSKSARGRGGMLTKLEAVRIAMVSGAAAVIGNGMKPGALKRILDGEEEGTLFAGKGEGLSGKRRWIAFASGVSGRIHINAGALQAISDKNASLLYAGVTRIEDRFERGDVVAILAPDGREVARGIVNYSSEDAAKLAGKHSAEIARLASAKNYDAVITRDNIAFLSNTHE